MSLTLSLHTSSEDLRNSRAYAAWSHFVDNHPEGSFFQGPAGYEVFRSTPDYEPFFLLGSDPEGLVRCSLSGVIQTSGTGLKSWFSRRIIVWGGPLVADLPEADQQLAVRQILDRLLHFANGRSIFVEIRNFFDTTPLRPAFEAAGFAFRPHLNYLVETDELSAVRKRMSKSRWRQIKSSRKQGATVVEPENQADVEAFYAILDQLYREKVKKPLPALDVFLSLWQSEHGKVFLVKHEGEVIGGIACPVYANRVIYEWYVCGKDGEVKGLHPSVLATWAPIEYALENGYQHFDFMGAGQPDQDYGVRQFKARFGGNEVAYGRYLAVMNKTLFSLGKAVLKVKAQYS